MSEKPEQPRESDGWVPSPDQPAPPTTTTEFDALVDAGSAVPDDEQAAPAPEAAEAPAPETAEEPPSAATAEEATAVQEAAAGTPAAAPTPAATSDAGPEPVAAQAPPVAPAWDPPAAADIPVNQTGGPDAAVADDRPERAVAAAFAGGALVAIALRLLVRR